MKWIWPSLLLLLSLRVVAQQTPSNDVYWKNWLAEAEVAAPKYAELCKIWKKTDGVPNAHLSQHEIDIVRYWETHQSDNRSGGNFPRMAAITAGNIRDAGSYDALEKLYLDPNSHGEMVREEAFRAIVKIDPSRAAKYVIKELSSGTPSFAEYADIVLKEAYGTSFQAIQANMKKRFKNNPD